MLFKKISLGVLVLISMSSFAEQLKTDALPTKASALSTAPAATEEIDKNIINEAAIKLKIISHVPKIEVFSISQSVVPGLYEIDTNGGMIYMTLDGNYFVEGDLYTFTDTSIKNLTEARMDKKRAEALAKLNPKEMIIFSPPKDKIKATITVFTDIDCGYCRKLHSGMKEMNDLGIEVRYLAFPRAGLGSSSYNKFVSAWCADNQQEALTKAKAGEEIPAKTCDNPVAKQYQEGQTIGVHGTPAIILSDGRLLPGYAPPVELAKMIGVIKEAPSSKLTTPTP
jgi:thiol:disulfide interchange protein DsbC